MKSKPLLHSLSFLLGMNLLSLFPSLHAENLIPQGHFETEGGWTLTPYGDAKGTMTLTDRSRNGSSALRLTKENEHGYLVLRSEKPIRVEPGVTYTFRGWFRAEDANIGDLLLFRVAPITHPLNYDSIDRSAGVTGHSLAINTPSGRWEKRVVTYRTDQPRTVYLHVVAVGNAFSVDLDDLQFEAKVEPVTPATPVTYTFPFSREEVDAALADQPAATAQLQKEKGKVTLLLDGEPTLPVIYKGLDSTEKQGDFEAFGKAGVPLGVVALRLGPKSYYDGAVWKGKDSFDLDQVDKVLLSVLQKNPKARIILDVWLYPYPEWGNENREEVTRNLSGKVIQTRNFNYHGTVDADAESYYDPASQLHAYPSIHSEKWKADAGAALRKVVERVKTSPYGKAVAGFYLTSGHDGQFIYLGTDDSKPGRAAFHRWLEERFGDIAALNQALGTTHASFDTIPLPETGRKEGKDQYVYGLEPLYSEFKENASWAFCDHFAGIVKEEIGRPVITLAYGTPISAPFYRTQHLDAAGTMTYYPFRNPGHPIGFDIGSGAARHGKLIMQEIDLRSFAGSQYNEVYQRWVGAGDTPQRWQAINRHLVGLSLAKRYGYWYYDMNNYYHAPEIHQQIAKTAEIARTVSLKPAGDFRPDVAVIGAEVGDSHMANRHMRAPYTNIAALHQTVYGAAGWMLGSSGVAYDVHYLDDILANPDLQDYKVYIFLQSPFLTDAQRQGIREKLANRGRTIIWSYDTGYLTHAGPSSEAQSALIGMNIRKEEELTRRTILVDGKHPYTEGIRPLQSLSDTLVSIFALRGTGGYDLAYQPFSVEDPAATVFGRYKETGEAAFAVRKLNDWTSVYLGGPNSLSNELLYRIASDAGAYRYGPPGQSVAMNDSFISIHALRSGKYLLQLPEGRTKVRDPFTGQLISEGRREVEIDLEAQQSYWYLFEP